ncbi:magnesium-dependent phosphatase-1 [Hesseltinella vesiculosa]|uniref:Magnesium-dependent phosphatase-1 n=1 Tax=Hesseltinella vesiculosa TaxID=101127 RepID=A0A1X2G2I8_9FUNG|nr:magnesium-dependent phosphatase-1 [Hesseltinella vesiculosa]
MNRKQPSFLRLPSLPAHRSSTMTLKEKNGPMYTRLPKMIVFDLDCTLWTPWIDYTYGPPFQYDAETNTMKDKRGEAFRLFKHVPEVFAMIKQWPDIKIGIASRSTTPDWCHTALKMFQVPSMDCSLYDLIDHMEIYPGEKRQHFKELHKASGIDYNEMLFFDDEHRNKSVTWLGVHFELLDPSKGLTMHHFNLALERFSKQSKRTQTTLDQYGMK